jgi:hypothetical protein
MRTLWTRASLALVGLTVLTLLLACGDGPTSPGIQPEVVNQTDNFQYQVTSVRDYSATHSYAWQNTGVQATINQAATVSDGSVTLVVLDANGAQVYSRSLADNGTFTTSSGAAGEWTVRLVYSGASGTLNFRADKTT